MNDDCCSVHTVAKGELSDAHIIEAVQGSRFLSVCSNCSIPSLTHLEIFNKKKKTKEDFSTTRILTVRKFTQCLIAGISFMRI